MLHFVLLSIQNQTNKEWKIATKDVEMQRHIGTNFVFNPALARVYTIELECIPSPGTSIILLDAKIHNEIESMVTFLWP